MRVSRYLERNEHCQPQDILRSSWTMCHRIRILHFAIDRCGYLVLSTTVNSMPDSIPSQLPTPMPPPITPSSTHRIPPSNAPLTSQTYSQNSFHTSNTTNHYPDTPPSPDVSSHHPSPTGNPPIQQRTA